MFERNDLEALKKDIKASSKEIARTEAKIAKEKARQKALAAKEAKKAAKEQAKQEAMAAKQAKESAALAKKEAKKAAKEQAKQEAMAAKQAKEAAALAKEEAKKAAKEQAKQEAMAAKQAKEAAALAKDEAEKAARERAKQEAMAAKQAKESAALVEKETAKVAQEKAKQEALETKKAEEAFALAEKEAKELAKEKAKHEAEEIKKVKAAAALAEKEAEKAAKEKAKQEAEEARKAREAISLTEKEAKKATQEKAKQDALVKKEEEKAAKAAVKLQAAKQSQEQQAMIEEQSPTVGTSGTRKSTSPISMVPLFCRRSVAMISIGLVLGLVLGVGYWIISPSLSSSSTSDSGTNTQAQVSVLDKFIGIPSDSPYSTTVNIQLISPGSSYVDVKGLEHLGEYYAAKESSLPFLEFLSQELADRAPQYFQTPEELAKNITVEYDWKSEFPALKLTVIGATEAEASFLGGFIPDAFQSFLNNEDKAQQQQEYQDTLASIDSTKVMLIEANQKLNAVSQETAGDISTDPAYIALSAKASALEAQLESQAAVIAAITTQDSSSNNQTLHELLLEANSVSTQLYTAQQKLQTLESQMAQPDIDDVLNTNPEYITLIAKTNALEIKLNATMNGTAEQKGLAQMIANGEIYGSRYLYTLAQVNRISDALAEARQQLDDLRSQAASSTVTQTQSVDYENAKTDVDYLNTKLAALRDRVTLMAQQSVDNQVNPMVEFENTSTALAQAKSDLANMVNQAANASVAEDLNRQFVQSQIKNLNDQLSALTEKATSLLKDQPAEYTEYLVAGSPSIPMPVLPERTRARNALMMGAVVGVGGAWILLNRKWIAKGMPSSSKKSEAEDNEG